MFPNNPVKRKNLIMWGLYSLLLFAVILIQSVYLGQFTLAGVHFDLLPLLVSAVAVVTGAECGGIFGLCAGFAWALSGGADGGMTIVCLTVSGVAAGYLCDSVLTRRLPTAVLMALMSLIITIGGVLLVRMYMGESGLWGLRLGLRQTVLTLPLSPLLYWAAKYIRKAGPDNG